MLNLKELVADQLATAVPRVRTRVLNIFVEEELEKRVKAVIVVIRKLEQARQEGFKLKPDDVSYDRDGKVVAEGYKRETVEAIKKNAETQAKLNDALEKAFDETNPNYDAVLKLGVSNDGSGKTAAAGGGDGKQPGRAGGGDGAAD